MTVRGPALEGDVDDIIELFLLHVLEHLPPFYYAALPQVRRELQAGDTAAVIANKEYRVLWVEHNLGQASLLDDLLLAHWLVFLLCNIKNGYFPIRCANSKYSARVWCPSNVSNRRLHVKGHDGTHVPRCMPHLDSPISRRREEDVLVDTVPFDTVNSHVVPTVRRQVLTRIGFAALVDGALFSTDDVDILFVLHGRQHAITLDVGLVVIMQISCQSALVEYLLRTGLVTGAGISTIAGLTGHAHCTICLVVSAASHGGRTWLKSKQQPPARLWPSSSSVEPILKDMAISGTSSLLLRAHSRTFPSELTL
jgi:hypothetical protein